MKLHRFRKNRMSGGGGKHGHHHGKGRGCGRPSHHHHEREFRHDEAFVWRDDTAANLFEINTSYTDREHRSHASSMTEGFGNCTLCKRQCPLSDPGCPKGEALAQKLANTKTGG